MTEPSLEELTLDLGDLPLDRSILTSSDPLLISVGQDIAEGDLKGFIFAIRHYHTRWWYEREKRCAKL